MGSTSRVHQHANPRGRRWSVRVGLWLVLLAIVPLSGAVWLSVGELHEVDEARAQVVEAREIAEELVLLSELRSRLLDERNYWSSVEGIEVLDLDPAVVEDFTGIDIVGELAATRSRVDQLFAALDLPAIADRLADLRLQPVTDLEQLDVDVLAVEQQVAEVVDQRLARLTELVGTAGDAAEVNQALQLLAVASEARQSVTNQFTAYWALRYNPTEGNDGEFERLVEQGGRRAAAVNSIEARAPEGAAVRDVLEHMASSPDWPIFAMAMQDIIDRTLAEGEDPDVRFDQVLDDLEIVGTIYQASANVANDHLALVAAASDDVVAATEVLDAHTDDRVDRAIATIAVLVVATLAFVIAVGTVIGRPLRNLADSAARLSSGDTSVRATPVGPTEVRQATTALNEAVDHLALAERQATAMAEGRFDDPVLTEEAPGALGSSLQRAVATLASSLADREEFRRRLAHEARHDSLTQVPNRRSVMHHLERSLARTQRTGALLAVAFIDLDDFKAINDAEGHPAGDAVLRTVATRLVNGVREGDQVGRLGGDEFLVVAEPVSGAEEALQLGERLQTLIGDPISVGDAVLSVSASIGVALVDATTDLTADEVLRDADLAVYKAKADGGAAIALCDDRLRAELEERAGIEHALRQAIADDGLDVHYQPIVHPLTGELQALEALVRWHRPGHGLVPPDTFVPHAERSDLIVDVDRWVIDRVARQLGEWERVPHLAGVPVAVNVSGRHLARADFAEGVLERLHRVGASPHQLIVEVTESAVLHDLERVAGRLQMLRDHGVKVSIDDFGTGYTSLAHLRTLPIDILKIDRTFTSDTKAASLVKLIIDTGHLLGARITAEGIETLDQADSLRTLGSDELQGFLYGHPVPADQLVAAVTR